MSMSKPCFNCLMRIITPLKLLTIKIMQQLIYSQVFELIYINPFYILEKNLVESFTRGKHIRL